MIKQAQYNKIQKPAMDSVQWHGGFWGDRFNQCESEMLPNLEGALLMEENSAFMLNFQRVSGKQEGDHIGTQWSDGDCYKWIQGAAHIFAITGNHVLDQKMDDYIKDVGEAQENNGYINTYNQLNNIAPWTWYRDHEIYNLGHLFTAASVHFLATGKKNFLDIAIKAADYTYNIFINQPVELLDFGFNPSNIMGLVELYRVSEDERYLKLAEVFIDMRGKSGKGDDLNQSRTPFKEEKEAVGHAVLANYLYSGAVDVYAHTGDQDLKVAIDRVYESAVNKKMYITGAQGTYYHGLSSNLDPVEEAFGHDYELPNRVAYTETCANIANAMFNYRLLNVTGDSKYADLVEKVMYNSGLSGANVDGTRFYYNNPLSRRDDGYIDLGGSNITDNSASERWLTHQCYCCPTSYVRTVAQVHEWAYGESKDQVYVHLYGASDFTTQINGQKFSITQTTDYPWDGRVVIKINEAPDGPVTLNLRVPSWSKETTISYKGTKEVVLEPQYYGLTQNFEKGDEIIIDMPMEVRFMRAHYLVEEAKGMVAVMRGPVVYCLEAIDIEGGIDLDNIYLQRNGDYEVTYEPDLLNGLASINTEANYLVGSKGVDLYEELPKMAKDRVKVKLIPYYAWSNRGCCDMSVWLPMV